MHSGNMATTSSRRRVRKKTDTIFFPDDVMIDILSRLPAKSVLRFRLVCKGWSDLTSTHDFMELHMRRNSFPMILVSKHTNRHRGYENVLLDKWWEPERKNLVFRRFSVESELLYPKKYRALFSHGGLIVFQKMREQNFLICNPTSNETVTVRISRDLFHCEIFGVFFHPLLKEYCTLWQLHCFGGKSYFKMLNLGSNPRWREISYPWRDRVMKVSTLSPVLIGDHIYWLLMRKIQGNAFRIDAQIQGNAFIIDARADIMAFDIQSEKLVLIHCPVPSDIDCKGCKSNLSDIDGVLSFVLISRKRKGNDKLIQVDIWKLKDGAEQLWVSMNPSTVKVDDFWVDPKEDRHVTATAVVGEMLVLYSDRSFYFWNHKLGTTRTPVKKYRHAATFCHVMTIASLKNCKSVICMGKEGEVPEESDIEMTLMA